MDSNRTARTYTSKPQQVEAFQFTGWPDMWGLFTWLTTAAVQTDTNVFYVPRGYEHCMREEREHDPCNGHILDDASDYLVVLADDAMVRVSRGGWLVRDSAGQIEVVGPADFKTRYQ